ncbi:MAG: ATP-binding domain-containing protein [Polyangiaceae bacterium]
MRPNLPPKPPTKRPAPLDDEREEGLAKKPSNGAKNGSHPAPAPSSAPPTEISMEPVHEEEAILTRVMNFLSTYRPSRPPPIADYEADMVSLRDQIAVARLEDVPALMQQMERIAGIAARRAENVVEPVDPRSPYFGHVRLDEEGRGQRDVLIGKTTLVDAKAGVRIVDWRHAPVSQIYYKYEEGAEYEEVLGEREVIGRVLARRTVTIYDSELRRVTTPDAIYAKGKTGNWRTMSARATELAGGQGLAVRPKDMRGVLGMDDGFGPAQRENRHLPEIAALLDPRQFELISKPNSGLVVIQGGAGSGKTTIGVHRLAYLAYQDKQRFSGDKMLVVVGSPALRAYIGEMLPSLGLDNLPVETYAEWAEETRKKQYPWLEVETEDSTPGAVTRLKTHPVLLKLIEERAQAFQEDPRTRKDSRGAIQLWAEILTDWPALKAAFDKEPDPEFSEAELKRAWRWCSDRCPAVVDSDPGDRAERKAAMEAEPVDDNDDSDLGADNKSVSGDDRARLDPEDDAILLRIYQKIRGELRKGKLPLTYEHLFVDEAQDLSPIDLAVLLDCVRKVQDKNKQGIVHRSATLAGDTAQRIHMDSGFKDWKKVLDDLGLSRVDIEPLRIAYRSTKEVLDVARAVLGHLADPIVPNAPRHGAPVELHEFSGAGAAVAFLADAIRPLFQREPNANLAILAKVPEHADAYYDALKLADIPNLRRVSDFEFTFRPGVDVTDVRQVKGLEYDYVVLIDVNANVYGTDDESRHLLHIGATRAAHQLWILTTAEPSPLLPDFLRG